MSGSKRKSQYRKSVTTNYLHTNISLEEGDDIAKIVCSRGANLFEIEVSKEEKNGLGLLPNKFRNLIWIKRNDFVIVTITSEAESADTTSAESSSASSALREEQTALKRFEIKEILNLDHIKSLKLSNNWPEKFKDSTFGTGVKAYEKTITSNSYENKSTYEKKENSYGNKSTYENGGELGYNECGEEEEEEEEDEEVRDRFGNTISKEELMEIENEEQDNEEQQEQDEENEENQGQDGNIVSIKEVLKVIEKEKVVETEIETETEIEKEIIPITVSQSSNNNNRNNNNDDDDEYDEYEEEEEDDNRNVEYIDDSNTLDACCVGNNWPTAEDITCTLCTTDKNKEKIKRTVVRYD